jgi:4-diphosphocytidyl-2-C-methyl-D-erythritol kinase
MKNGWRELAFAKINLGLFLGPSRAHDGRHELATVMQSISLADELTLAPTGEGDERDEIVCPGVSGPPQDNLAAIALRRFREATGWRSPPLRLSILKRIPVAAGLAGGSADAAAALRLAARASGLGDASSPEGERLLGELARELGADVPAQLAPGRWLATGAGEHLQALPAPSAPFGVLVLALDHSLSTAAVYREADRLGLGRQPDELAALARALHQALANGAPLPAAELLHNDLQRAAVSLCPPIDAALAQARAAGATVALVSGSGPTVLGLFQSPTAARDGAARLAGRVPAPVCAQPVHGAAPSGA